MGRPAGPIERVAVDTYIVIVQRKALCYDCGTLYIGAKEAVKCRGCGMDMITTDVGATKKIPTGIWSIHKERQAVSNSSIIGEVPQDGGG